MSAALRRELERMPAGSLVPRDWVLQRLDEDAPGDVLEWVGIVEAEGITDVDRRQLRRMAVRWDAVQVRGHTPEVRVVRAKTGAHWRFCRADCYAFRRRHGGGPRVVAVPADVPVDVDEAQMLENSRRFVDRVW